MPPPLPPLYPLKFTPLYQEKVWGGREIERLGRRLPGGPATRIGESWELADLDCTSPSGAGGGPACSTVCEGPLTGTRLRELLGRYGTKLLGRLRPTAAGGFPLLVKFLDARRNVSVQVHPPTHEAGAAPAAGGQPHEPKSEAWYVIDAAPGACIYKGVRPGVGPAELRAAALAGAPEAVEALLHRVPVKPGDCHYLPGGTCHAIGAGLLLAEIQTPSDTTYRVFDWDRHDRELHLEQALRCMRLGEAGPSAYERRSHQAGVFTSVTRLVLCEHFRLEKVRMSEGYAQELPYDQPAVWVMLEGGGRIASAAGEVAFTRGETLLLPAELRDARVSLDADTTWLEVTFPQASPEPVS